MDFPHDCYSNALAHQAVAHPEKMAVVGPGGHWTHAEAVANVDRIAHCLLSLAEGAGPVAILMDHDSPQIIALLGVMRSGLIAMPLDPGLPGKMLLTTLLQAGASLVITEQHSASALRGLLPSQIVIVTFSELLAAGELTQFTSSPTDPDSPCAILHTLAADGNLRGVVCTHRILLTKNQQVSDAACFQHPDRICVTSPCHHSLGFFTVFRGLLGGACVLPFELKNRGLAEFKAWLRTEQITGLQAFSSIFRFLCESLSAGVAFPEMRLVKLGGEPVFNHDVKLFQRHFPMRCRLINTLSVTEANGPLCEFTFDGATVAKFAHVPVGQPAFGSEVILVDEKNQLVNEGDEGEVAFRIPHHTPAYWRCVGDKEKWIPSPSGSGASFLKTGDRGRISSPHGLVLLGRKDRQIKIRGQRIQPQIIETLLLRHSLIKRCFVAEWGQGSQQKKLVAWIVPHASAVPSIGELRTLLSEDLPDSMIPSVIMPLSELPLAANGRVDLAGLADPFERIPAKSNQAENALELKLLPIFQKILRRKQIGMTDSFFESGGDSLLAAVLLSRIQESFGMDLPLEDLVNSPSIRGLANTIRETPSDREYSPLAAAKTTGDSAPFFYASGAGIYAGTNHSLGNYLQNDHPFYSLRYKGIDGVEQPQTSVEEIASYFVQQIQRVQPHGPYFIGGGSFGGLVAFEAAQQLRGAGEDVAILVIEDTRLERSLVLRPNLAFSEKLKCRLRDLLPIGQQDRFTWDGLRAGLKQLRYRRAVPRQRKFCLEKQVVLPKVYRFHEVLNASLAASKAYCPKAYAGRTILIRNLDDGSLSDWYESDVTLGWGKYCRHLEIRELTGKHGERDRNVTILKEFAALIDSILQPPYGGNA